jgi:NitT/TauT family transport system permease protein
MTYAHRVVAMRALVVLAAALALEIIPRVGVGTRLEIIPFSEMLLGVVALLKTAEFWHHLFTSVLSIGFAFLSAAVFGVAFGYLLWRMPRLYKILSPYLVSYYAIPIFAFYPVLIVMFGANRIPIFLLATGWGIVAVVVSTVEGLALVRDSWEKVADVYHLNGWQRAFSVHLPAAWPQMAVGMRLAATYCILGVISSEFILSSDGLGYMVNHSYNSFEYRPMWGGILVVLAVGIALDLLVSAATRRLGALR